MKGYSGIVTLIVGFANRLRESGIKCSTSEVIDACRAAELVYSRGLDHLREALRATLAKSPEHYALFDELFDQYWLGATRGLTGVRARRFAVKIVSEKELDPVSAFLNVYSPLEVSWERRIAEMKTSPERRRRIGRTLRLYSRILGLREGRRKTASIRGYEDLRRSMKGSLRTFGEIVRIARSSRKRTRSKLVLLADVSGSMMDEWEWLCDALAALKQLPSGSYEAFLFSTRLQRITDIIESMANPSEIARAIVAEFKYWGSGTRIGEALEALVNNYAGILRRDAAVLIISDGWDLGDLGKLERSLAEIKRRVGHMAWITPHASNPGFAPSTSCLKIALKYVDILLPTKALEAPRMLLQIISGNGKLQTIYSR